jgi:hypothetical protein
MSLTPTMMIKIIAKTQLRKGNFKFSNGIYMKKYENKFTLKNNDY